MSKAIPPQPNTQTQQPSSTEVIRQVEKKLSPVVIDELHSEYVEKKKNENNVTYLKDNGSTKKTSLVNPNQLQTSNNEQEDEAFFQQLAAIQKEYPILISQLNGANKLKPKYKMPFIESATKYFNHVKQLSDMYRKKLPIIRLHKEYQREMMTYYKEIQEINGKLNQLERVNICKKAIVNREINVAGKLLATHDNVIQTLLKLEPRNIILNAGEVIIERIVEAEPNEEKVRLLVAKYIERYLPKQKVPEPIIQTETKTVVVPGEPDLLGKAHQLLYGQKNYAEAIKILRDIDSKGNVQASATLGTVYVEGLGVRKDIPKAVEYFKKAIKGGSAEAMYKMAVLLEKGQYKEAEDRQTNIVKAIEYYRQAALKNDLNALTDLAFLLENGRYVQKDVNEAHSLLKRAADWYYPRALNNLGSMYYKGLITDKGRPNDEKAFEYFKLAADQGYPKAFTNLGICYEKGRAVPKNPARAVEFYTTAAELHDVDGIFHLGYYIMEEASRTNDEERYSEAADMFREAISVDPEYVEPYYYLGFLFENGLGVDKDMKTAFRYYRKAADLDYSKAYTKLGTFYSKGFGIARDPRAALEAYEKAAELEDPEAMNILGIIYEEGIEVPPDFEKAYAYYAEAAELGNSKARLNLGLMFERGRITQQDFDEALNLYVEAADMGNVTAQMMLSTRDFPTQYRNSFRMSHRDSVRDEASYDEINVDSVIADMNARHGSPKPYNNVTKQASPKQMDIPTTTSQYVKAGELRKNSQLNKKEEVLRTSIPEDGEDYELY